MSSSPSKSWLSTTRAELERFRPTANGALALLHPSDSDDPAEVHVMSHEQVCHCIHFSDSLVSAGEWPEGLHMPAGYKLLASLLFKETNLPGMLLVIDADKEWRYNDELPPVTIDQLMPPLRTKARASSTTKVPTQTHIGSSSQPSAFDDEERLVTYKLLLKDHKSQEKGWKFAEERKKRKVFEKELVETEVLDERRKGKRARTIALPQSESIPHGRSYGPRPTPSGKSFIKPIFNKSRSISAARSVTARREPESVGPPVISPTQSTLAESSTSTSSFKTSDFAIRVGAAPYPTNAVAGSSSTTNNGVPAAGTSNDSDDCPWVRDFDQEMPFSGIEDEGAPG
ncbi:hypothetical protein C8J56DRAFT_1040343 [Mycena floridula]|nr:hypothetical protein C8J56DRAFT_1040343 [Mycena floridula]